MPKEQHQRSRGSPPRVDPSHGAVYREDDLQLITIHNGTKIRNHFGLKNMRDKSSPEFGKEFATPRLPGSGGAVGGHSTSAAPALEGDPSAGCLFHLARTGTVLLPATKEYAGAD